MKQIYYRKKGKGLAIEGRLPNGKPLYIWALPDPETLVNQLCENAPFFKQEKRQEIIEKLKRLATKSKVKEKRADKVRLARIIRPSDNGADKPALNLKSADVDDVLKEIGEKLK